MNSGITVILSKAVGEIKIHINGVKILRNKLKLWGYEKVLNLHENLEYVNESINKLDLVPDGF